MKPTRLKQARTDSRPTAFVGPFGTIRYIANQSRSRTRVVGPTGVRGLLECGRHSLEVHYEGTDYVLVSRGARRPTPRLETSDGTALAAFSGRRGKAAPDLTEQEAVLVALIAGSGIADVTRPQAWAVRH